LLRQWATNLVLYLHCYLLMKQASPGTAQSIFTIICLQWNLQTTVRPFGTGLWKSSQCCWDLLFCHKG
jgi:hypothetical protein